MWLSLRKLCWNLLMMCEQILLIICRFYCFAIHLFADVSCPVGLVFLCYLSHSLRLSSLSVVYPFLLRPCKYLKSISNPQKHCILVIYSNLIDSLNSTTFSSFFILQSNFNLYTPFWHTIHYFIPLRILLLLLITTNNTHKHLFIITFFPFFYYLFSWTNKIILDT